MECLQLNSSGKCIHRWVLHWLSRLFDLFIYFIASYLPALGVTLTLLGCSKTELTVSGAAEPIQNPSALSPLWFAERRNHPLSLVAVWATAAPEAVLVAPVNSRLLVRSANAEQNCKALGLFSTTGALHLNRPLCILAPIIAMSAGETPLSFPCM